MVFANGGGGGGAKPEELVQVKIGLLDILLWNIHINWEFSVTQKCTFNLSNCGGSWLEKLDWPSVLLQSYVYCLRRHEESQVGWKEDRKKLHWEKENAHSWKEKDKSTCSLERSETSSVTAHPVNGKSKASGKLVPRSKAYIQGILLINYEKVLFIFYFDSERKGLF